MNVNDIIERLGGTKGTAEIFGVTAPAVSNWRKSARFPGWTHLRLVQEAAARGIVIPTDMLKATAPLGPRKPKVAA